MLLNNGIQNSYVFRWVQCKSSKNILQLTFWVLLFCFGSISAQTLPSCSNFTPVYQMQNITTNCDIPEISVEQASNSYIAYCSFNSKAACSECFRFKNVPCEIVNCIYEKISEVTGQKFTTNCIHPGLKKYVTELYIPQWLSPDLCPSDNNKILPGICGCGVSDNDSDGDGTPDCNDQCPNDNQKIQPGVCGCGVTETDSDSDGSPDCNDQCPNDNQKIQPGVCGCGVLDTTSTFYSDNDSDGFGSEFSSIDACSQPAGYVSNNIDCNDSDTSINPSSTEVCDNIDNNCDGNIDEGDVNLICPGNNLCKSGVCVECTQSNMINCSPSEICGNNNTCATCNMTTHQCPLPLTCNNDICVECTASYLYNCSGNEICGFDNTCAICNEDTHPCPFGQVCDSGVCVECTVANTDNCLANELCGTDKTCKTCNLTTHICPNSFVCDNSNCVQCNSGNTSNCTGNQLCGIDNTCAECNTTTHICPNNAICLDGQCVECTGLNVTNCAANEICGSDNTCAVCNTTTHLCPNNGVCDNNVCVQCTSLNQDNCVGNEFCGTDNICNTCNDTTHLCVGEKDICKDNQCVECTASDVHNCDTAAGEFCGSNNRCLVCNLSTNRCPMSKLCILGQCVDCTQNRKQNCDTANGEVCGLDYSCGLCDGVNYLCPAGKVCDVSNNECKTCLDDNAAPNTDTGCSIARPVCDTTNEICVECLSTADCSGKTPICDVATNTCGCQIDADCAGTPGTPACDLNINMCVACTDSYCTTNTPDKPMCDQVTESCVECTVNTDCSTPTEYCKTATKTCVECLADNTGCSDPTAVCDLSTDTCVQCLSDTHCINDPLNENDDDVCDIPNKVCVECLQHSDCALNEQCDYNACASQVGCTQDFIDNGSIDVGECYSNLKICDVSVPQCVDCLVDADCQGAQYCVNNRCWDSTVAFKGVLTTAGYYKLKVNGVVLNDGTATESIACEPLNASNEVVCWAFNRWDCYSRRFSREGVALEWWQKDTTCGYEEINAALAIWNTTDPNTRAGKAPDYPAVFSGYHDASLPPSSWSMSKVLEINGKIVTYSGKGIGCGTDPNNSLQVECIRFMKVNCIKRLYNINGYAIPGSVWTVSADCGYSDIDTAQQLINRMDIFFVGDPIIQPAVFEARFVNWGNIRLFIDGVDVSWGWAGQGQKGMACRYDSINNTIVHCTGFRTDSCTRKSFTIYGVELDFYWQIDESCGYVDDLATVMAEYNLYDSSNPNTLTRLIYASPDSAAFPAAWKSTEGDHLVQSDNDTYRFINSENPLASGCKINDVDPDIFDCVLLGSDACRWTKFNKYGFRYDDQPVDYTCGYNSPATALEIYNSLTFTRSGPPPTLPETVTFEAILQEQTHIIDGPYDTYVIQVNGSITNVRGLLAAGCMPEIDNKRLCYAFDNDKCYKREYSTVDGAPQNQIITDTTCGYNNFSVANALYNSLDPAVRMASAPPNDNSIAFVGVLNQDFKINLKVGETIDQGIEVTEAMGCYPEGHFTADERVCYGFNMGSCYTKTFSKTGFPLTVWQLDDDCGYKYYTNTRLIYNALDPSTLYIKNALTRKVFKGKQDPIENNYYLEIGGVKQTEVLGNRAVGCKPVQTDVNCEPYPTNWVASNCDEIVCVVFGTDDCSRRRYKVTGSPVDANWIYDENCGYYDPAGSIPEYNSLDASTIAGDPPSTDVEFRGVQSGDKYYLKIDAAVDNTFPINLALGCKTPNAADEVECVAFFFEGCYKRKYTRFGTAIDPNWGTMDSTCGYNNYTAANSIYILLNPITLAGPPPSENSATFSGYQNPANNKYYLAINGNVIGGFYVTQGIGCKAESGGTRICVGFGNGMCFRRTYSFNGYPIDPVWFADSNCGFVSNIDGARAEYQQIEQNTYQGNVP